MYQNLKKFFEENPEATECHFVLGYFLADKDEAVAMLAGVKNEIVKSYTKEQFEQMAEADFVPAKAKDSKIVATFKKVSVDKMPALIEQQKNVVSKMEAGLKAADDKDKAERALNFHDAILLAMQEAYEQKLQEQANNQ